MTKEDLDIVLESNQKKANHYRVQNIIKPDEYNEKMLKKIDRLNMEAVARFHNQDNPVIE